MNTLLYDLAKAHEMHEGYFHGSRSWRNRNPGNLRAGSPTDLDGFTIFPSYEKGFQALMNDIRAKITGHSAHIDYSKNPTFFDYVNVYAPAADGNDPASYAMAVLRSVGKYGIMLHTPLAEIAKIIEPSAPKPFYLMAAIRLAERIAKWSPPLRMRRILDRIKSISPPRP